LLLPFINKKAHISVFSYCK